MGRTFAYMRISTQEEKGLQKFTRQEQALERWCKETDTEISERRIYKDDASGKSFDRPQWKELREDLQSGDTVVFKELSRFTRECDNGLRMYMELLYMGVNLVFIDNPTISTDYIKSMMDMAERQKDRLAKFSIESTIQIILLVELDRCEKERELIVKRIKDGIEASPKKSGRKFGQVDKLTPELREDIKRYLDDRSIKAIDLVNKHCISRNTLKKYIEIVKAENN